MPLQESVSKQTLENRITKLEIHEENMIEDLKEIKTALRWFIGLIFSLNATIIGIFTNGFGIF